MQNLPANIDNAINAMEAATQAIDLNAGDFSYLKLEKAGSWVHGSDDDELSQDNKYAIATESFCAGFQAWDDGELVGEEIRLLTEPPVTKTDLEEVGAEWKPLIGCQLVCIEGADKGLQLMYKTTSKGGIKAVNTLMKQIVSYVKAGEHDGKLTPIIQLAVDSYRHKRYGKIYTPVLDLISWTADVEITAADEHVEQEVKPEPEPEPEVKPARRRRRNAA